MRSFRKIHSARRLSNHTAVTDRNQDVFHTLRAVAGFGQLQRAVTLQHAVGATQPSRGFVISLKGFGGHLSEFKQTQHAFSRMDEQQLAFVGFAVGGAAVQIQVLCNHPFSQPKVVAQRPNGLTGNAALEKLAGPCAGKAGQSRTHHNACGRL